MIGDYTDGCFSRRLPQTEEGVLYRMFSAVDRLATMLQAQNDAERASKIFLRNTISDISHQLKTPLAALSMYQEIMENEPDQPDVIREFTAKTGTALRRMEQLIQSMLKITRLDAGNVVFEKRQCSLRRLIEQAVSELATRAQTEQKTILIQQAAAEDSATETILCDPSWTSEAVDNLVKDALDHTHAGGIIRITWERSPLSAILHVADNGDGISSEELHHIFKRQPIVEGQGGTVVVQNLREFSTQQHNNGRSYITEEQKHIISALIDINDRYAANHNMDYESTKEAFDEILYITSNIIDNKLENLVRKAEFIYDE